MSFLTEDEKAHLSIESMILHVVGEQGPFIPQPKMDAIDHPDFFLARLMDAASSSVHEFELNSIAKSEIEDIATTRIDFEAGAQVIARRFKSQHGKTTRDGAFFIFEMKTHEPDVRIYAMIKYDYRQAIEQVENDGRAGLRAIIRAFIGDPRAIQKSCIIRTRDGLADAAVSARDRMASSPDLTDYFANFLSVKRQRTDEQLNQAVNETLRGALTDCRALLPALDVPAAMAAARDTLRNRQLIDNDAIIEAILVAAGRPEDEEIIGKLEATARRKIAKSKLEGLEFKPDLNVLKRAHRKKVRTVEGVLVEYPGDLENTAVTRANNPEGGLTITIKTTQKLLVDELVPEKRAS